MKGRVGVATLGGSELVSPRERVSSQARVAEWQTQWTQNPPRATSCEFDSRLGHQFTATTWQPHHPTLRAHPALPSGTGMAAKKVRVWLLVAAARPPTEVPGGTRCHDQLCPLRVCHRFSNAAGHSVRDNHDLFTNLLLSFSRIGCLETDATLYALLGL